MMTDKEALAKIVSWIGAQQAAGASPEAITKRFQDDPSSVAAEIGVPESALNMEIFDRPDTDELLAAGVEAAFKQFATDNPDSAIAALERGELATKR